MRLLSILANRLSRWLQRQGPARHIPPHPRLRCSGALVPREGDVIFRAIEADAATWPPREIAAEGRTWRKAGPLNRDSQGALRGLMVYVEAE